MVIKMGGIHREVRDCGVIETSDIFHRTRGSEKVSN
jgi:hypothetical protein